jgi:hypothetical protein
MSLTRPRTGKEPEMENLLAELGEASRRLAEALEAEADCGEKAFTAGPADPAGFARWLEARRAVMESQEAYSQTLEEYGRLLEELSPRARLEAGGTADKGDGGDGGVRASEVNSDAGGVGAHRLKRTSLWLCYGPHNHGLPGCDMGRLWLSLQLPRVATT